MYQYYVFEIMRNTSGEYSHEVHWAFDTDANKAKLKGESTFYDYCSKAAISEYPHHTVTLFNSNGEAIMSKRFTKTTESELEPPAEPLTGA